MSITNRYLSILTILAVSSPLTVLHADLGVSITAANQKNQYKGSSNKITFFPDLIYRENNQQKQGGNISYDLVLTRKNAGFKAKDNNVFRGMKTRKDSLDLGAQVLFDTSLLPVRVEASKDLLASKGYQASVKLGGLSAYPTGGLQVRPFAGIRYQSAKVIDYHYGVRANEATSSRKTYKGKAAITPFLGVEATTNLSKNIQLTADFVVERRASSIANSSLVNDSKNDLKGSISLAYWF